MMKSPDWFISEYENATYSELIKIRDTYIREVRKFEKHGDEIGIEGIARHPSPEVVYQMNLEYLGKLCELISKKYNQEFIQRDRF